jgi:hypothetical protein
MNCRGQDKKAFMNCFAMIIRIMYQNKYREVHVKAFNTGKLEIPGVPDDNILEIVRAKVLQYLGPHLTTPEITYVKVNGVSSDEVVLVNSGFNCGFCINLNILYRILKSKKYGIETSYDSCHYPGVKCKYYYKNSYPETHELQNGRIEQEDFGMKLSKLEMSKKYTSAPFMIFSTGNCLVVGNCPDTVLVHVFEFMKRLLHNEYNHIYMPPSEAPKPKNKKQRKKTSIMTLSYFNSITGLST